MKRSLNPGYGFLYLVFLFTLSGFNTLSAQSGSKDKQAPIPGNIKKILWNSCMPCHGENGGRLPTSKFKFSRWKAYGQNKQAEKAAQICSVITAGKMPPKAERIRHPERIPTQEQTDMICKWADSIKPYKTKK